MANEVYIRESYAVRCHAFRFTVLGQSHFGGGFRDGIVYVSMVGACEGCLYAQDDISAGVEIILMEEVPGVLAVRTDEVPADLMTAYLERKAAQ